MQCDVIIEYNNYLMRVLLDCNLVMHIGCVINPKLDSQILIPLFHLFAHLLYIS